MSAPQFTPGPWAVEDTRGRSNNLLRVVDAQGRGIVRVNATLHANANARLIAAAADYDAAAQEAIDAIAALTGTIPEDQFEALMAAYGSLRRAQYKARGEQVSA